jgi:hypothetical protein
LTQKSAHSTFHPPLAAPAGTGATPDNPQFFNRKERRKQSWKSTGISLFVSFCGYFIIRRQAGHGFSGAHRPSRPAGVSMPGVPVIVFILRPARPAAHKCRDCKYDKDRHRDDNAHDKIPVPGQYDSDKCRHHHAKGEQSDPVHAEVNTKSGREMQLKPKTFTTADACAFTPELDKLLPDKLKHPSADDADRRR